MSYPIPQWLFTKMLTEQPRPDTAELRAQATAAIAALDKAIGRRRDRTSGSWCATCKGPIKVTDTACPHCNVDWRAAAETRAASDARQYGLKGVYVSHDGMPIEFSHHDGAVIEVR